MNVLVTISAHFMHTPDGALWVDNPSIGYAYWTDYLGVYDELHLLCRSQAVDSPPPGADLVSGPGVKPAIVPDFVGPAGFARNLVAITQAARQALANAQAVQLRVPCFIGGTVWRALAPGRPYGVEVVADPYDVFAPGAVNHPARPFFRWWFPRVLRQQCARATAALYVTRQALQSRYPCPHYSIGVSDVTITPADLVAAPRPPRPAQHSHAIVFVGGLNQLYKAPDVLIDAVSRCVANGLDLTLHFVGDGHQRQTLERQAAALGLSTRVVFHGQLTSRAAVRAQLDRADLFVLASRQEGLPRAMVEAMARGLPCIGSTVGGLPELLPAEDLVRPGYAPALAAKIHEIVTDPARMAAMSARNLATAQSYRADTLRRQRTAYYGVVRDRTHAWLRTESLAMR